MTAASAELRTRLSADPAEVPRARRLVAASLRDWGLRTDPEIAVLLTSELVTNALLHGTPPLELRARASEVGLHVEVHDTAPARTPRPQRRSAVDDLTGRGLALVEALSDRWGWEETPSGKLVWFELSA